MVCEEGTERKSNDRDAIETNPCDVKGEWERERREGESIYRTKR